MKYKAEMTQPRRAILARYGVSGIGIYWLLIAEYERLQRPMRQEDIDIFCEERGIDAYRVHAICYDYGAFAVLNDGAIEPLDEDCDRDKIAQQRERAQKGAIARWSKRIKPKAAKPTQQNEKAVVEIDPRLATFNAWLTEHCQYLSNPQHIKQLTFDELEKLKKNYDSQLIADTLLNMENRKDLRKNYVSLYRALLNWLKNAKKDGNNRQSTIGRASSDEAKEQWLADMQRQM